jgi:hypothetical protein
VLVEGHDAAARAEAVLHLGHVGDAHRLAVAGHHHHVAHVVEALEQAEGAHHQGFVAAAQQAAAAVAAGGGEGLADLGEADGIAAQPVGVDAHLHLADRAAEADHLGDARHHAQGRADRPVLHRADVLAAGGGRGFEHVAVDLADGGGEGRQGGLEPGGRLTCWRRSSTCWRAK